MNFRENTHSAETAVWADMQETYADNVFSPVQPKLLAHAWTVYDFSTDTYIDGSNQNEALPLASLTKLMTTRITLETHSPKDTLTVAPSDLLPDGNTGLVAGEKYTFDSIIKAALVASSNNAATALARNSAPSTDAFIAEMNTEAAKLNLPTLRFASVTGLDASGSAMSFGSANDILALLHDDFLDFPNEFINSRKSTITIWSESGSKLALTNTDLAINNLPMLVVSKTGYTDAAGGNLAVLWQEPGGDLFGAAVLGSTESGRFSDMTALRNRANLYSINEHFIGAACQK